jgi:hypothetical protein
MRTTRTHRFDNIGRGIKMILMAPVLLVRRIALGVATICS